MLLNLAEYEKNALEYEHLSVKLMLFPGMTFSGVYGVEKAGPERSGFFYAVHARKCHARK